MTKDVLSKAITDDGRLKVQLVPMPGGDDPWRTRADYEKDQKRETYRFYLTIAALVVSIISIAVTSAIAIVTVQGVAG